jgi:hypothetical protein
MQQNWDSLFLSLGLFFYSYWLCFFCCQHMSIGALYIAWTMDTFYFILQISREINALAHMLLLLLILTSHPITCPAPAVAPQASSLVLCGCTYTNLQHITCILWHGCYYTMLIGLHKTCCLVKCDTHPHFLNETFIRYPVGEGTCYYWYLDDCVKHGWSLSLV